MTGRTKCTGMTCLRGFARRPSLSFVEIKVFARTHVACIFYINLSCHLFVSRMSLLLGVSKQHKTQTHVICLCCCLITPGLSNDSRCHVRPCKSPDTA